MPVDLTDQVIDVGPPRRGHWRRWVVLAVIVLLFALSSALSIYVEAIWFGSLGYASVYWYKFRIQIELFALFGVATLLILRVAFWLVERAFASTSLERRTVLINNQTVSISPSRIMRPAAWIVAGIIALIQGLSMSDSWQTFALYFHQAATTDTDPIFHRSLGFYLFNLPIQDLISGWLSTLAFIILAAAVIYTLLSIPQKRQPFGGSNSSRKIGFAAVSWALAIYFVIISWRVYLSRFPHLWEEKRAFTGVTYMEDHYYLPGLIAVALALLIAAAVAVANALSERRLRLLIVAIGAPVVVFIVAGLLIPAYVTAFIVKPNELDREGPYIEHNLTWTKRAYGIDRIEVRDFDPESTNTGFNLAGNRPTLDNLRLWDWHALQDTLKQLQEIRTYYDFPDVDVDRYQIGGQKKQMMLAAREIETDKLPESSRNWVNERLIYTHGYGLTMNTANGFTPEGMPQFVLSNMPIQTTASDINVTRPEIYFGEKTDTDVYVKTKQNEFNYPQGDDNNYTTYEGTGGIPIGSYPHRLLLAWVLSDISNLPFSTNVTPESRVLMRRNIIERIQTLAPFLVYDKDPYIVVGADGHLYWMLDAYTETDTYPYSRHDSTPGRNVNYLRNSVKVVTDAYNGSVTFYIFDSHDPLIASYRSVFPALFRDAAEMPSSLREHVRYPETLIKTQGEIYGLYHTQNPKVFFQREDVWNIATEVVFGQDKQPKTETLEPYYVMMQLPGEETANEFVEILPFTPSNRNNMIGWMAGRSDGDAYGTLLVYNFPKSRLVDGPMQIEARIDQNAQLSSQITLWNQQGSHVRRGNLLVIPIGRGLLYVEPIYLQAERSPMPELRLVVLATQDRLGYGPTFEEAMTSLFGEAARGAVQGAVQGAAEAAAVGPAQAKPEAQTKATLGTSGKVPPSPTAQLSAQDLAARVLQELEDYQRLTSQGKLGEAGQKLEAARRDLEEAARRQQ